MEQFLEETKNRGHGGGGICGSDIPSAGLSVFFDSPLMLRTIAHSYSQIL